MKRTFSFLPIGLSIGALVLAGCGSSDEAISIENAWARTSAAGQTTGAIYFDLTADEADTLVGASVPDSIAGEAQVHEIVMAEMATDDMESGDMESGDMESGDMESGDMDDMDDSEGSDDMADMDSDDSDGMDMGAMTMQELTNGLPLAAGETVSFEPGSYHVMLLDLVEPLEVGDEVEVTLDFANADDVTLTVEVAESAP